TLDRELVEIHLVPRHRWFRWLVEDEVAPVVAVDLRERAAHLLLHALESPVHALKLVLHAQDARDADEVETDLRRQLLDQAQPLDVAVRVETRVAGRPLR